MSLSDLIVRQLIGEEGPTDQQPDPNDVIDPAMNVWTMRETGPGRHDYLIFYLGSKEVVRLLRSSVPVWPAKRIVPFLTWVQLREPFDGTYDWFNRVLTKWFGEWQHVTDKEHFNRIGAA